MNTTVVQAHPLDDSLSMAFLEAAVEGLRAKGVEPRVVRLSVEAGLDATAVDNVQHLVFVYPTWWGSTPAMLLGPLAELLSPWVDGGRDPSTSPLRSVERLTVVTSHGSSRFVNLLQGEPGRQLWKRTVLRYCAKGADFDWVSLYKVDRIDGMAVRDFIDGVTERLAI